MSGRKTQGKRVCRWIERYCVFTDAEWIGQPFRFQPWQRRLVYELFEANEDGTRRHRWALIGMPKKNGKTTLAAAIALYLLIGDEEPSPLVACAAASEEQADLVFGAAKTMCEMSLPLKRITERYDKEIVVPSISGARLIRVAAAVGTNDGKNLHGVICDELHEWAPPKGDNVWNVLTNGIGARRQPLILQITTAGYDLEGTICGQQYTHGRRVQSGEVDDPTYYFWWREAPADADYRDPATWEAANPSYGVTVQAPFFRDQLTKKTEAVFRRYFLNQWTTSEEIWIPETTWDACKAPDLDLDPALPLYVGIDMAHSNDSAAVVCVQRQETRTVVRARVWDNPYPRTHAQHEHWRISPLEVEHHLRDLSARFPVPAADIDGISKAGPAFYYDPAWFSRSAPVLEGDGLAMIEFPQTDARMVPASQTLFQMATEGLLAHDGDPVLKRHVLNAVADHRPRGWRLSKPRGSRRKIDACIALAIGVYGAQERSTVGSVYETRSLLVLGE